MSDKKSLVLIADDAAMKTAVEEAVAHIDELSLETHDGTLSSVNGSAVHMLHQNDLVIFRVTADDEDMSRVRQLRSQVGASGTLLALSDQNISLSAALALKKTGVDEILPFPLPQGELTQQIERLAITNAMLPAVYDPAAHRLGHVIAVCPARGGIGASTIALNLADQLQGHTGVFRKQRSNHVVVVDLDVQFGTLASALDLQPCPGLFKMAQDQITPDQTFLRQCIVSHESGLDVLTAPEEFMPPEAFSRAQIAALITALRRDYDYVVIDLPRSLVEWFGAVVSGCDRMLMITDSSVPAIRQTCRLIDFFAQERLEPPIDIVINHEAKPLFRAGHHVEAEKALGRPLKHWLPFDPKPARAALDRGELLSKTAGKCPLSKALRGVGKSILQDTQPGLADHKNNAA